MPRSGSLTGKNHSLFLGPWSNFSCSGVAFSGETVTKTVSSLTVTPELTECAHQSGAPKAWTMNGCKFRFNPGPGPALTGTMDIVNCTNPMKYTIWGSCVSEIGNQSSLGNVEYQNILVGGVPAVKVIAKLTGIKYTRTNSVCGEGEEGTFSDGTYQGEWIVKGASKGGAPVAAEVESTAFSPTRFAAEEGPVSFSASNGYLRMFDFFANGGIECEGSTFSGTASIVPTASITVTPSFQGCSLWAKEEYKEIPDKDITAGGCSYQLQAAGGFAIVGANCAANPITISAPGCVFTLGPQSGFPGPVFSTKGSGKSRTVSVPYGYSNLQKTVTYTAAGAGCVKQGTFNEASPKVRGTFSGKTAGGAEQGFWLE